MTFASSRQTGCRFMARQSQSAPCWGHLAKGGPCHTQHPGLAARCTLFDRLQLSYPNRLGFVSAPFNSARPQLLFTRSPSPLSPWCHPVHRQAEIPNLDRCPSLSGVGRFSYCDRLAVGSISSLGSETLPRGFAALGFPGKRFQKPSGTCSKLQRLIDSTASRSLEPSLWGLGLHA